MPGQPEQILRRGWRLIGCGRYSRQLGGGRGEVLQQEVGGNYTAADKASLEMLETWCERLLDSSGSMKPILHNLRREIWDFCIYCN